MKKLNIKQFRYINAVEDDRTVATILLYMPIGKYVNADGELIEGVNGEQFAQEMLWLQDKVKRIDVRINSIGGQIIEGFNIINAIQNSKVPVYTYNDFFAASISSLILASGHKRFAKDFANVMIHNPHSESEDLTDKDRECMELFRNSLLTILKRGSILSQQQLDKMLNAETYLDAVEAQHFGFIDEIIPTEANFTLENQDTSFLANETILNIMNKVSAVKNIVNAKKEDNMKLGTESSTSLTNSEDVNTDPGDGEVETNTKVNKEKADIKSNKEKDKANSGNKKNANSEEKMTDDAAMEPNGDELQPEMLSDKIADCMGLADDASEEEIYDSVKGLKMAHEALKGEHAEAKSKLSAIAAEAAKAHKDKLTAMVNSFVDKGIIENTEVDKYLNLANTDFELTKSLLEKATKPAETKPATNGRIVRKVHSMAEYLKNAAESNPANILNTANFTLDDYRKKAPEQLIDLMETQPETYSRLLNEHKKRPKKWAE